MFEILSNIYYRNDVFIFYDNKRSEFILLVYIPIFKKALCIIYYNIYIEFLCTGVVFNLNLFTCEFILLVMRIITD